MELLHHTTYYLLTLLFFLLSFYIVTFFICFNTLFRGALVLHKNHNFLWILKNFVAAENELVVSDWNALNVNKKMSCKLVIYALSMQYLYYDIKKSSFDTWVRKAQNWKKENFLYAIHKLMNVKLSIKKTNETMRWIGSERITVSVKIAFL